MAPAQDEVAGATEMTREEIVEFLREPRYVSVGTLRRDGSPFVVGMSFLWHDDAMHLTSPVGRAFNTRLERDPRICCTVLNEAYPVAYVRIEGRAVRVEDPGDEIARALMRRYLAPGSPKLGRSVRDLDFDTFFRNYMAQGPVAVWRVEADRIFGYDAAKKGTTRDLERYARIGAAELRARERGTATI